MTYQWKNEKDTKSQERFDFILNTIVCVVGGFAFMALLFSCANAGY